MKQLRLDKYLSDMNVETRSRLKQMIRKGQVTVNGEAATRPEMKVVPGSDRICVLGNPVGYRELEYYLLHKPAGVVSATEDRRDRTVLDLLPDIRRDDLFPVGRLDKDTEGLLLITNDGSLAHKLLSPNHHVEKVYYAEIDGPVTEEDQKRFKEGIDIGDPTNTLPAGLDILSSGETSRVRVTLTEGRYHQIKRMFEASGKRVVYLKRLSMGPLALDENLRKGEWRSLTPEEIQLITN